MRRRTVLVGGLGLAGLGLLGGCQTPPPPPTLPPIRFTSGSPIRLAIAGVEIEEEPAVTAALASAAVEGLPTPPHQILRNWATDRLAPTPGAPGIGRFHLIEAALVSSPLPRTSGISGAFTTDQVERIDLRLAARFDVQRDDASMAGSVIGKASGYRTLPEDQDRVERRQTLHALAQEVAAAFDREMSAAVRDSLAEFVR